MDINFDNIKCKICKRDLKNRRSLGNHLARSHKPYDVKLYVLEFFYKNEIPKCKCGCGKEVKWHKNLYKFNDYLTGHNESIFSLGLYKETEETKEKRLKGIRKSYKEKGKSISKKISSSVKEAFDCDEKRNKLSEASKERWKNEKFRTRVSNSHKKSWQENYDERYDKTFTEEFRKKISDANKQRDVKVKSKLESYAFEQIKNSFNDAISDYWIQIEGRNKCFDVYIPKFNLLVELDGKYWHGLDRQKNFTKDQIVSMKNDLLKNRVFDQGYNMCRVCLEDNDFNVCFNEKEDIYNLSYYVKDKNGDLNKDLAFKFKNLKQPFLDREHVIKLNQKDKDWVSKNLVKPLVEFFQEYTKSYGWFYPEKEKSLDEVILKLRKRKVIDGKISSSGQLGNSYLKSNFKSFWNVKNGPVKSWEDYKAFERVMKYRLGLNNSKLYEYKISDNTIVKTNETFDISPHNLVRGFVVQRRGVSWFKPVVAYEIYTKLLKNIETPVVWDPSMGFGARMLGFVSAYKKGIYFGTDPASQTFYDLKDLKENIEKSKYFDGLIEIKNCGSEEVILPKNVGDLVFTSPPYFDIEKYFDEKGQSWRDYPDINLWQEMYLKKTLNNAFEFLKDDGKLCINISSKYSEVLLQTAEECNFDLLETLFLDVKTDHFNKKRNVLSNNEPIFIFKKTLLHRS